MKQARQHEKFDYEAFSLGGLFGAAVMLLLVLALASPDGFADVSLPVPEASAADLVPARDCAIRAVYYNSIDDDYQQRALFAEVALNQLQASGVGATTACAYPPPDDAGGLTDAYRWQSATDAVLAVGDGDYTLPPACSGVNEVWPADAAPTAPCVSNRFAFLRTRK